MAAKVLAAVAATLLIGQASAGKFLASPEIKAEDLEADLLAELAASTHNSNASATSSRIATLEAALRPTFAVMPKEVDGTLNHNVVRYALQRFFEQKHGWFIRGLETGKSDAVDGPSQAIQEWAPAYLQTFLEKVMAGRGVNLKELAVFAATLEDVVHKEEKSHLLQAYASYMQETSEPMDQKRAFNVLEAYMMIYMLGGNWTQAMAEQVESQNLHKLFSKKVSHWDDTLLWVQDLIKANHVNENQGGMSFNDAQDLVAQVGDRFATFNTGECTRLKADLLAKESAKPGRIRLVDFYKMGLQGAWEFNEKMNFLRDTGILDESDPETPLVILPNYVLARSNCLASSTFYSICCPNECEQLMQSLEANINSSTARPAKIAKIVSTLSSPTVAAPRTLSKPLMRRLQDVAASHDGEIPLHGRLFAQWMHHAFPRECPYPHAAGSASSQTADEWMLKTGQADSTLSKEEILAEVATDSCRLLPKGVECDHKGAKPTPEQSEDDGELPWDSSEELLVVREPAPAQRAANFAPMKPMQDLMCFCALAFVIYGFVRAMKSTNAGKRLTLMAGVPLSTSAEKPEKCFA